MVKTKEKQLSKHVVKCHIAALHLENYEERFWGLRLFFVTWLNDVLKTQKRVCKYDDIGTIQGRMTISLSVLNVDLCQRRKTKQFNTIFQHPRYRYLFQIKILLNTHCLKINTPIYQYPETFRRVSPFLCEHATSPAIVCADIGDICNVTHSRRVHTWILFAPILTFTIARRHFAVSPVWAFVLSHALLLVE